MKKLMDRIDVLLTTDEKRRITQAARDAGVSTGEYMRRAAAAYCPLEEAMVGAMLRQLNESTLRASAAIDDASASIEASNQRIAQMEHGKSQPLMH